MAFIRVKDHELDNNYYRYYTTKDSKLLFDKKNHSVCIFKSNDYDPEWCLKIFTDPSYLNGISGKYYFNTFNKAEKYYDQVIKENV